MKFGKITSAMALTMAVATVPAFALNTRTARTNTNGQYQTQQSADQVFARLDTNGDGVVSRNEWPRDAASFDRLDLNRDGVISRTEAQQVFQNRQRNGEYEKGQRFRGMDTNGDGAITRDEWRGNDQSFSQHDRNRDGVLSGDELRGNGKRLDKQNHGKGQMKEKHGKGHDRD